MKKLLLHSCCGPCSTAVIEKLKKDYEITVFYYNPNIYPKEEFEKRQNEQIRLLKIWDIDIIKGDFDDILFDNFLQEKGKQLNISINSFAKMQEGEKRCELCFEFRLTPVAQLAKKLGYDCFSTTLSISPYKNSQLINQIGNKLANEYSIAWLESDFKKNDGYKRSIELSHQYNLYRQKYCGCKYSLKEKNNI